MASGAAATISAEFDAQVALIDNALRRPGLSTSRQAALWRERVQVLRESAGFESTRRWLAANGERYDGALVRVD
jgi:type II secretory pathway component PulM